MKELLCLEGLLNTLPAQAFGNVRRTRANQTVDPYHCRHLYSCPFDLMRSSSDSKLSPTHQEGEEEIFLMGGFSYWAVVFLNL